VSCWISPQKIAGARKWTPRIALAILLSIPIAVIASAPVRADDAANEAVRELARKIATQLHPKQKVDFEFRDPNELISNSDLLSASSAFSSELLSRGIQFTSAQEAEVIFRVTLAENLDTRFWIVQFQKGGSSTPIFLPFAKPPGASPADASTSVRIESRMIFESADTILDFAVVKREKENPIEILILGVQSITLYDRVNGQWHLIQMLQIPHKLPTPRDPRGRLLYRIDKGDFFAGVPGTMCSGKVHSGLSIKCESSATNWWSFLPIDDVLFLVELEQGRNFFRPIELVTRDNVSKLEASRLNEKAYQSETQWAKDGKRAALESHLDGRIWLFASDSQPVVLPLNWGSDFAAVEEGCGRGTALLATGPGDYVSPDYLQVFELKGETPVAVSSRTSFSGPITAVWEWFTGDRVHAVVHNLKTGHYEAYEITLACDH
jgi:hypothetical protein